MAPFKMNLLPKQNGQKALHIHRTISRNILKRPFMQLFLLMLHPTIFPLVLSIIFYYQVLLLRANFQQKIAFLPPTHLKQKSDTYLMRTFDFWNSGFVQANIFYKRKETS